MSHAPNFEPPYSYNAARSAGPSTRSFTNARSTVAGVLGKPRGEEIAGGPDQ